MPFAVELYFDDALDGRIRETWTDLGRANLPSPLATAGARPQIGIVEARPELVESLASLRLRDA